MTQTRRSPGDDSRAPSKQVGETTVIMTRTLAGWRDRRIRRWARRELDVLLGEPVDPWRMAEPIDWAACQMDRGVPEREHAGRELLAAGWCP